MIWLLIVVLALLVSFLFWLKRTHVRDTTAVDFYKVAGDIFYLFIAGLAIITAAVLYISEKQWAPRITTDMDVNVAGSSGKPGEDFAVVQTIVSIRNLGRSTQKIWGVQYALLELKADVKSAADRFGDLPARGYSGTVNKIRYTIDPGETERIYFETSISCAVQFARVLVKVPKPGETKMNYERKAVLPISKICREGRPVEQLSHPSATPGKNAEGG